MTETEAPKPGRPRPRPRRRRRGAQNYAPGQVVGKICPRESCDRPVSNHRGGLHYCSALCRSADIAVSQTERVCRAVGPDSTAASELWASVVELSDQLTRYQQLDGKLQELAESVGIGTAAWFAIRNG